MTSILLVIDVFSGHLYHDVELFVGLFSRYYLQNQTLTPEKINFYLFLDNDAPVGNQNFNPARILGIDCPFFAKGRHDWIGVLCNLLFNIPSENIHLISKIGDRKYDFIVDREKIDHMGVNTATAPYIKSFPCHEWSGLISPDKADGRFSILYLSRQNTARKDHGSAWPRALDEESHEWLCGMVEKYNGTIVDDMGSLSPLEQIKICRKHDTIISVYGNELTSAMWMQPQCRVFQIFPSKFEALDVNGGSYHCLCLCMQHHYTQIDCEVSSQTTLGVSPESRPEYNSPILWPHTYILSENNKKLLSCHFHLLSSVYG